MIELAQWILAGAITIALASSIMHFFRKKDEASTSRRPAGLNQVAESVWELHSPIGEHNVDIVFFHGLQTSDHEEAFWKTWSAKDNDQIVWPKDWLSQHLPNARILSVSYNSCASKMKGSSVQGDIFLIGENLVREIILEINVGQNDVPVFLVGHCLGGIILKLLILSAVEKRDEMNIEQDQNQIGKITNFLKNFRGSFFYGVPSGGIPKRRFEELTSQLQGQSPILKLLKTLDTGRARVNEEFRQQRDNWNARTFALAEGLETTYLGYRGLVVPEGSIRLDVDNLYTHTTADHFTICKARDMDDFTVIRQLTRFITETVPAVIIQPAADLQQQI